MVTNSPSAERARTSSPPSLLREQLAQFNGPAQPPAGATVSGRRVFGLFLTVCGLCVSGWVLYGIHTALFHPERLGLPLKMVVSEELTMTVPAGKIELPVVGVRVVGYLLTVVLLAIGAKIGAAQLRLGVSLMSEKAAGAGADAEGK